MYEFQARVRYSETDEEGRLRLVPLVNYLQDCSTFHSTDRGCSVADLLALHRAWLLCYWDIYVDRLPGLCEDIWVGTSPHALRGILAYRNFWVRDREGRYLVRADSVWFMLDTEKGRPVRPEEALLSPFGAWQDVLSLPRSPRHVELPAHMEARGQQLVRRQQIDSNRHMNNAQYIALAEEVMPEGFRFRAGRVRAEYRQAARLGERLLLSYGEGDGGQRHFASIRGEDGEVCANVEIG